MQILGQTVGAGTGKLYLVMFFGLEPAFECYQQLIGFTGLGACLQARSVRGAAGFQLKTSLKKSPVRSFLDGRTTLDPGRAPHRTDVCCARNAARKCPIRGRRFEIIAIIFVPRFFVTASEPSIFD